MPRRADADARREDVSKAVWRVASRTGVSSLTLRAVATEAGCSTGLVTYWFKDKRELLRHAVSMANDIESSWLQEVVASAPPGFPALEAALTALLPFDETRSGSFRFWLGFWSVSMDDPVLLGEYRVHYESWRQMLAGMIVAGQRVGVLDPRVVPAEAAIALSGFIDGIAIQLTLDPDRVTPALVGKLVTSFLHDTLGPPSPITDRVLSRTTIT